MLHTMFIYKKIVFAILMKISWLYFYQTSSSPLSLTPLCCMSSDTGLHQGHRGNGIHGHHPPARGPEPRRVFGAELIDKEWLGDAITGEASPCAILAASHRSSLHIQQYLHIL